MQAREREDAEHGIFDRDVLYEPCKLIHICSTAQTRQRGDVEQGTFVGDVLSDRSSEAGDVLGDAVGQTLVAWAQTALLALVTWAIGECFFSVPQSLVDFS